MSQQVYSNPTIRYHPDAGLRDTLVLRKNNVGPPAYGSGTRFCTQAVGNTLSWDRLNGNNNSIVMGGFDYDKFQNPSTKSYYNLTAEVAVLGGGTLLHANIDCVINCNVTLPYTFFSLSSNPGPPAGPTFDPLGTRLNAYIGLMDSSLTVIKQYGSTEFDSSPNLVTDPSVFPRLMSLSCAIPMKAGQSIATYIRQQDVATCIVQYGDLISTATMVIECLCEFSVL